MSDRAKTYLEAALEVLGDAKHPLSTREILEEALRRGLIRPAGKTPEATLSAELYRHIHQEGSRRLRRVFEPGGNRARRGSVKWALNTPETVD
jgi:hypothetical protein